MAADRFRVDLGISIAPAINRAKTEIRRFTTVYAISIAFAARLPHPRQTASDQPSAPWNGMQDRQSETRRGSQLYTQSPSQSSSIRTTSMEYQHQKRTRHCPHLIMDCPQVGARHFSYLVSHQRNARPLSDSSIDLPKIEGVALIPNSCLQRLSLCRYNNLTN